nr:putative ribonuclease H-like domain-containing protein [Tanacetum cinerariifolium]
MGKRDYPLDFRRHSCGKRGGKRGKWFGREKRCTMHTVQQIETTILVDHPAPASPKSNSSGTRRNRKACFVCKSVDHLIKDYDFHTQKMAQPTQRNYAHRGHHKPYATLTHSKPQKHMVPTAVLTQSKLVSNIAVRPVSAALPNITVTRPRHAHHVVTKFKSPIHRHITRSPSSKTSNSPPRVTVVQAPVVSVAQGTGPTWLFDIDSLTRTMNYQLVTAGNQTNFGADAAFDGKEHDFDAMKPESVVILSSSNSAQSRKQDDKTKKEDKGKSPVESFTGDRDLNAEFEDYFDNSSNEVTAAGSIVSTVGQNTFNSTNTFSAAGPSNTTVTPTYGKSSSIDASQLFDDPDMPELEDITYSDDEDVVGAEADFNNLESSIPVSPIPTIRIHKDHLVSQIIGDLSSTTQTRRFEDPDHPDKVYKVVKALYGLHQAPRAWYKTLATYLLENGFQRGTIDQTLFIKKQKGYILLVQIYVDDIIFGATNKDLCRSFEKLMKDKFQMSSMGKLTFFLSLQVKQKKDGIFTSQDIYVAEILRKFGLTDGKSASTPINTKKPLLKDPDGEDVDVHTYRSMIGSLMYLTSSRSDIMFALPKIEWFGIGVNAAGLKVSAVRHKLLPFSLTNWCCSLSAVSYIKYALTVNPTIYVSCIKQFWNTVVVKQTDDVTRLQALVDRKKVVITEAAIRDVLRLDDAVGVYCLPNEEIFSELARMGYEKPSKKLTFYKAFFSSQWNLVRNVDSTSKFYMYPRFIQLLIRNQLGADTAVQGDDAQEPSIPSPTLPPQPSQDLPSTSQEELDACAALTRRVENLEYDKVAQALEITKLKRRVKKLEKGTGLKANKDIDWDVAIEHVKQKAKEDPVVQRYQVMKKMPQTEA